MIRQIKVSGNRLRCVFVVFLYSHRRSTTVSLETYPFYLIKNFQSKEYGFGGCCLNPFTPKGSPFERDDKNASKPVARHFNLPNHSMQHMTVCGLSLHQGNTESRKTLEQKFIFQIGTLNPDGINKHFSFN